MSSARPEGSPRPFDVVGMPGEADAVGKCLTALEQAGITLPPHRVDAVIADHLELRQQVLLIRAACPPGAPLPLGFTGGEGRGGG